MTWFLTSKEVAQICKFTAFLNKKKVLKRQIFFYLNSKDILKFASQLITFVILVALPLQERIKMNIPFKSAKIYFKIE